MGQTVSAFRSLNPTRRLEGPQGMTPSSTLTYVHIGERPFIRDSITVIPCCHEDTIPFNLATITTLVGTTYTVFANATIPIGNILTTPAGFTFVIPAGITLTVNGTLRVNGTLVVNGTLINNSFNTVEATLIVLNSILINNGITTTDQLLLTVDGILRAIGISEFKINSIEKSIVNGTIALEGKALVDLNADTTFSPTSTIIAAPQTTFDVGPRGKVTIETLPANITLGKIIGTGDIFTNVKPVISQVAAAIAAAKAAGAPGTGPTVKDAAGAGGGLGQL